MADPSVFKLFRAVDPDTVNVPIKDKFAKLTLSSNKKKQVDGEQKTTTVRNTGSNVSRQLLKDLSKENQIKSAATEKPQEHPLLRSDSSSSLTMGFEEETAKSCPLDVSDYMDALQLSADGCTQQTAIDKEVERLSTQVTNLTMEPQLPVEVSICISSTTEEEDEEDSCITISDTTGSECDPVQEQAEVTVEESMAVSDQQIRLDHFPIDKVEQIQAFLRDVSFERRRGVVHSLNDSQRLPSRLASADTESMSQEVDVTQLPSPVNSPKRPLDSSKLLADDETEVNTVCSEDLREHEEEQEQEHSKRLADNDTEVNTMCSEELQEEEQKSSKRLADNDTEVNTVCSEEQLDQDSSKRLAHDDTEVNTPDLEEPLLELSAQHSTLDDVDVNESLTIPETCSEAEQSPVRPRSSASTQATSESGETEVDHPAAIQVSNINISAKINIKIHIPTMYSSSTESDDPDVDNDEPDNKENLEESPARESEHQAQQGAEKDRSILCEDASEDEQFLTNAEKLLNQLYGKSWQTPDVIRTLKRSSGSGGKMAQTPSVERTPLTTLRRQPRARPVAATTAKKRIPAARGNDSALGDFSIFKRALHSTNLNSTQKPAASRTEQAAARSRIRTNHIDEDRWRALVDSDSGTDASDDDDADATSSSEGDSDANDDNVTYLDLTKGEVVSNPDSDQEQKSPGISKKLLDILRTHRATVKPKMCATPTDAVSTPTQPITSRRQLFTPNTGYEDDEEAKRIVDQAVDLDSLDTLEQVYLPGTNVHKRMLEAKRKLGIPIPVAKGKPIFKLPTPHGTPVDKAVERPKKLPAPKINAKGKCSFIKSLERQISRENCDNEAYFFRENFARNREALARKLYNIFNEKIFDNKLDVPITWSKLLRNTAGKCRNKQRLNERSCVVVLSVKVLTSADRLRCTLIHELCHAATWIFHGEGGHGRTWRMWCKRAMMALPDLPPIQVCHNYVIEFKYTYRCNTCNTSSRAHSNSKKLEHFRCRKCRGPIVVYLNKKGKDGQIVEVPVRKATGFAKYVQDNFQKHKTDNLKAAQVMRILSAEYAKEKQKPGVKDVKTADDPQQMIANQVETLVID